MAEEKTADAGGEVVPHHPGCDKPLSGAKPPIHVEDLPADLVEASPTASAVMTGAMGIPSAMWRTIGNLTAMVIIAAIAVGMLHFFMTVFREDRASHREELRALNAESSKKWDVMRDSIQAIKENQDALITISKRLDDNRTVLTAITDMVRDSKETTKALTGAVKELTTEVRRNSRRVPIPAQEDGFEQGLNQPAKPEKPKG